MHLPKIHWPFAVAVFIALTFAGLAASVEPAPAGEQKALVSLGLMILGVGLSILAGYLLEKQQTPLQDERPTPLATRGSYIAWFRGVRRLGYVLTWAGERFSFEESGAGKGDSFGGPKQKVWAESGMHVICVGPVDALLQIESAGEIIFDGPITPTSHPSGSAVDLGSEGTFRIFWGEDDQPVNTFLGDSTRIGVSSRWPNMCYVEWRGRKLGTAPRWPFMSYTVRMKPSGSYLSDTDPWFEPTRTLTGNTYTNFYAVNGPGKSITLDTTSFTGSLGNFSADIRIGDKVRLTGAAIPDQDLTVANVLPELITPSGSPFAVFLSSYRTVVVFEEDLTGITTAGSIQLYIEELDEGANIAHEFADMLFESWPQGASLSTADWDMDSLEDLGTRMVAENLRTTLVATEGDSIQNRFGAALQDIGYMVPLDPLTGLVKFHAQRAPSGTLVNISDFAVVENLPELDKLLDNKPTDFMIFGFPDRANNFRDMTIGRMEDGQISFLERANANNIALTCTTHYDTAATMANRRTQEEMGQGSVWDIDTNRYTRLLLPGQPVTADFTSETLRILEVEPVPLSNRVRLKVTTDIYGIEAQTFVDPGPPEVPALTPVQPDLAFALVEVPEYFTDVPPQTVIIPRIRAHAQIQGAGLHLSADGTTYTQVSSTTVHNPGGALTTALTADGIDSFGRYEPADGDVQFTAYGPDIANALDLTGDPTSWRAGRQLAIIVGDNGIEICYLRKVTVVSGSTYSLDGLIRARYGTQRLAHSIGSLVFIVDASNMTAIQDVLLSPQVLRYAKTQPTGNGTVSLADVPAITDTLYGEGVRPLPVQGLRVTAPRLTPSYANGEGVTVEWNYATPRTPGTSAGLQGAGVAVGTTDPEGDFQVEILNGANTVVATYTTSTNSFSYSNAQIIIDLGSQVTFKVRVTQLRDGYLSDTKTLTVEKV